MEKTKTEYKTIGKDLMVRVEAEYHDDSFDYPGYGGGTHHQGYYEVTAVAINDQDIPLDILDDKFLDMLDKHVN